MKMKIYIIGIGLIGGSFAMEMRKLFPKSTIIGIDTCSVYEKLSKVLLLLWTMLLWLILLIMMADRDDDYSK